MNIKFRIISLEDAEFIRLIFTVDEYEPIFYENETSVDEWKERLPELINDVGLHNYVIVDNNQHKNVGWIMYEISGDICKLHLIVLNADLRGKHYGVECLNKLLITVKDKVNKIILDVQKRNEAAVNFYMRFGFTIFSEEIQSIRNGVQVEYYNMEYIINK